MTLTDFIFDTLKEVVSEYDGKTQYNRASQNKVSTVASGNTVKKYPYSKVNNSGSGKKRLISEQFVLDEMAKGRTVVIGEGDIVTPSARDILNRK